jgi:hypothetical protein
MQGPAPVRPTGQYRRSGLWGGVGEQAGPGEA